MRILVLYWCAALLFASGCGSSDPPATGDDGGADAPSRVDAPSSDMRSNQAPTCSGIAGVHVSDATTKQTVIDLFAAFEDDHDADADLTYEIAANSNPALFESTDIDPVAGTLTLRYVEGARGHAEITLRVTDTEGASVESSAARDT